MNRFEELNRRRWTFDVGRSFSYKPFTVCSCRFTVVIIGLSPFLFPSEMSMINEKPVVVVMKKE